MAEEKTQMNKEEIKTKNSTERAEKIKEIRHESRKNANLLAVMVVRNVKTMYRESVLGIIWTVLNPLLTMFVLSFVYSQLFGRDMTEMKYSVYVLSGMLVFNTFFRAATTGGLTSIVSRRALVMQTRIPVTCYPRIPVYTSLVNFAFAFIALIIVMLIYKQPFKPTLAMVLVLMPALTLFTLGASFILSVVYVYFRDIKNIYAVFVTLLNYVPPIFYTINVLNNPLFTKVLKFNPMYYYVDYFRTIITGHVPGWEAHLIIYGMGIFMYAFGYLFISVSKKKFIFHL